MWRELQGIYRHSPYSTRAAEHAAGKAAWIEGA